MERDIAEAMLAQSRLLPKKSGKNLDSEPVGSFLTPSSPIKKTTLTVAFFIGEPGGIRTHDPLIKSQMLYRLSYEPSLSMSGYIKDKKYDVNKKS